MSNGDNWAMLDPDAHALLSGRGDQGNMAEQLTEVREYLENMPYPETLPTMASVEWIEIPGPDGDPLPLQIVRPNDSTNGPVIVYFHSGGMVMGSAKSSYPVAANLAHYAQATVVNVDYRLAPEHPVPAQAEDCYAATVWVAENAEKLGVDASRLATFGDSAGGTLSAAIPLMARDRNGPEIICQVIVYGGVGLDFGCDSMRQFHDAPGLSRANAIALNLVAGSGDSVDSPYVVPANAHDLAGLPSAIVVTGEIDPIRDWSEEYARRLQRDRVQVTMTRYPGMYHGFFMRVDNLQRARLAMAETGALLQAKFAHPLPW